ncbi:MAG: S-layer protein domain-containing protein [Candidatus Methanoperedens sp.]|nr:S-layer protein domain-containing protein [Candidatus Methanoperedens sp.]
MPKKPENIPDALVSSITKAESSVILLLFVSIIASGCIDQDNSLPQPETLSDAQKESFTAVDQGIFLNNPDEFTDRNILIRGKVSWISYEGGKTALIINLHNYDREPVAVYYQGRLPGEYRGTDVAVYGIAKGRNTIKNTNTGEDIVVPQIFAVQVNPSWIDEPVSSNPDIKIIAESKSLATGETWDMGSGYTLLVNAVDEKASPKQAWISLEREGKKLDDKVMTEGEIYTYRNMVSFRVSSIYEEKLVLSNVRIAS